MCTGENEKGEKFAFEEIHSPANNLVLKLKYSHLCCAILLILAKLLRSKRASYDYISRFLETITIPLYIHFILNSYAINQEKEPFDSKGLAVFIYTNTTQSVASDAEELNVKIKCDTSMKGSTESYLELELEVFAANIWLLILYAMRSRFVSDSKQSQIEKIRFVYEYKESLEQIDTQFIIDEKDDAEI